jgi:hypothetical protein
MTFPFSVVEHTFQGQHIRELPVSLVGDDENLILHAKQNILVANTQPQSGDLTIVTSHANGFRKKCTIRFGKSCLPTTPPSTAESAQYGRNKAKAAT